MIPGINHAARRIQYQRPLRILLQSTQNLVERRNFFLQILRFPFRIGRRIRPAHPRRHTVDSRVSTGLQPRCQLAFNHVVTRNRRHAGLGNSSRPESLSRAGHTNQRQPQRPRLATSFKFFVRIAHQLWAILETAHNYRRRLSNRPIRNTDGWHPRRRTRLENSASSVYCVSPRSLIYPNSFTSRSQLCPQKNSTVPISKNSCAQASQEWASFSTHTARRSPNSSRTPATTGCW